MVNGSKECTILVLHGSLNYVFYSDVQKAKLCKVAKMEEVRFPKECVFFGYENVQHAGDGWKWNHCLTYHLYLIREDAD